ncbi:MAG: hypothetical protein K2V38_22630, partial [Gemmataceae bacterium]|nr:hypothetical protein [Gemmataceae bacterium]
MSVASDVSYSPVEVKHVHFFNGRASQRLLRTRLCGEVLETRCVLATYKWSPPLVRVGDLNWDDWTNWNIRNDQTGAYRACVLGEYPGQANTDDNVIFDRADESICNLNITVSLRSLEMRLGNTNAIFFDGTHSLTISGSNNASFIQVDGGALAAPAGSTGTLIVNPGAVFTFRAGELRGVDVDVKRGEKEAVMQFLPLAGRNPVVNRANVNVSGRLLWSDTPVGVAIPTTVTIKDKGIFDVKANNKRFGNQGQELDTRDVTVINQAGGTVVVDSAGQGVLIGTYQTAGTTKLVRGELYVHGSITQTAGTFELAGGTLTLAASTPAAPTLYVQGGTVSGSGTINGNLSLGDERQNDPNPAPYPLVEPGGTGKIGQITINGNFVLYNGQLRIEIAGAGANEYDRIVVRDKFDLSRGLAARDRSATGVVLPAHAAIAANAEVPFLTFGSKAGQFGQGKAVVDPNVGNNQYTWTADSNDTKYWYKLQQAIPAVPAKMGGLLFRDNGALAGVFEPGTEALLAGIVVRLFDATWTTQLASTTTGADGRYEFATLSAGSYVVAFDAPTGQRFT